MGTAPVRPSVAIGFKTLEAYRQLHRVCPRLSIQAQVRALCYLHHSRFETSLVDHFSIAFDMYLDILHHVDLLVNAALHRDAPDWQSLNMCPPCMYKLEGEGPLSPAMLVTMDGNQSLKLVDNNPSSADPTSVCVDRWRNAGPESRKRMFALFAVTGLFVSLCRHGHCLAACDMIRSGELMKYALAHVDRLASVYGCDLKVGYDVACAFRKILMRSSLGPRIARLKISGVVPAFHGHSHNRGCQVDWHPLYMDGVGKEDFEGCERLFSESNALAPGTRLSTAFHRHQAIEQFMGFWSDQKHAESGKFIFDNYRQALDIIKNDGEALRLLCQQLSVGPADFERYLLEERAYFKSRKAEPPEVTAELDYVESLMRLKAAGPLPRSWTRLSQSTSTTRSSVRTKVRTTQARWDTIHEEVLRREEDLNIVDRWKPGQAKFDDAYRELGQRKYRLALDKLERLVVLRLFELTKLQLSGTGYKLREKIGKALKARADAIKKALGEYNARAAELSPPRDELLWADVLDMSTLADFDLLRETRQDIRAKPWAKPAHRRAMNLYFNIKRAHEEVNRLNIEMRRLFTYLLDEHADYHTAVSACLATDAPLAHELRQRWRYQEVISTRTVRQLVRASNLPGFTGKLEGGHRIGRGSRGDAIPLPPWARDADGDSTIRETGGAQMQGEATFR
ncbi:hypothetical protein FKP32DRAFT_1615023 [Trametes sanguinea]|nr:hypothetical protein FKP32DRAFT_1615023 [Trametes sanguinea]